MMDSENHIADRAIHNETLYKAVLEHRRKFIGLKGDGDTGKYPSLDYFTSVFHFIGSAYPSSSLQDEKKNGRTYSMSNYLTTTQSCLQHPNQG